MTSVRTSRMLKWSLAHRISRLTDQLINDEGWVGWNIFGWHLLLQEFGGATANIRFKSSDGGRDSQERMTQGLVVALRSSAPRTLIVYRQWHKRLEVIQNKTSRLLAPRGALNKTMHFFFKFSFSPTPKCHNDCSESLPILLEVLVLYQIVFAQLGERDCTA